LNDRKKLSEFGQKYRLVNSVTASFNPTVVQMTEMSQKKITEISLRKKIPGSKRTIVIAKWSLFSQINFK